MRAALLALLALAATGCEDAVDPTLGTDQAFSLFGYLDPTADRQAVRVVPITTSLDADISAPLDVTVTATEPGGRTATFRDSVVTYADGSIGHVFVSDYTPTPGVTVELSVEGTDSRQPATVSVAIPPLVRPTVGPPVADLSGAVYPVTVRGIPRVLGGSLRVFVMGLPGAAGATQPIDIPIETLGIAEAGGVWTVSVPFLGSVRDYLQEVNLFNAGLTLVDAEFRAFVANEAWAVPAGGFDLDAIAEPGTFSNVNGGFGFVGGGYATPVRWIPSTNVQRLAGFSVIDDPAAQVAVNEVGSGYVELFNPTDEVIDVAGYLVTGNNTEITLASPSVIQPGSFLQVGGAFSATDGASIQFLTGSRRLLSSVGVEATVDAWGAYPDGYSLQLPQGGPNLFYGPVVPSPSRSNAPAEVPAVINEVSTSGDGFVEVLGTGFFATLSLASSPEGLATQAVAAGGSRPYLVAPEGGGLALDQLGGVVFLLAEGLQVVDARFYGPQTPERSSGYLPDGPSGDWMMDLLPTPGAANALARFQP